MLYRIYRKKITIQIFMQIVYWHIAYVRIFPFCPVVHLTTVNWQSARWQFEGCLIRVITTFSGHCRLLISHKDYYTFLLLPVRLVHLGERAKWHISSTMVIPLRNCREWLLSIESHVWWFCIVLLLSDVCYLHCLCNIYVKMCVMLMKY